MIDAFCWVLCFTLLQEKFTSRDNRAEESKVQSFTLVMEVDMLSLQLGSSLHPDSETQQSELPNPPVANVKKSAAGNECEAKHTSFRPVSGSRG